MTKIIILMNVNLKKTNFFESDNNKIKKHIILVTILKMELFVLNVKKVKTKIARNDFHRS
jgi:hypothetical protein